MRITKGRAAIAISAVLVLLVVAGGVGAHPSADEPGPQGGAGLAGLVSPLLHYQARVTYPSTGEPVADGDYAVTFSLYEVDAGGTPLWSESKAVAISNGLLSTTLGDATGLDPSLFHGQELWLEITFDGEELSPRQQIVPVAYALSLVPGATILADGPAPALHLGNLGDGEALHVLAGRTVMEEKLTVFGSTEEPMVEVYQSGPSVAGYFTSTQSYGLRGETAGTSVNTAGVLGVAGWTPLSPGTEAGVLGKSAAGMGVAGYSETGTGVHGASNESYGVLGFGGMGTSDYGGNFRGWGGVYGSGSAGYGGRFTSSSGTALYAEGPVQIDGDTSITGDLTVTGQVSSDGVRLGRIYLTDSGTICSTRGGTNVLEWDKPNNDLEVDNTSGDWLDYWYTKVQELNVLSAEEAAIANGQTNFVIVNWPTGDNNVGAEVHFGQADGPGGWCSVWVQYSNGALVGHYICY